ncbi:hypothetical protein C8J57DRAFT_1234183 [Mycena rebaudengoi]|nr:hypothetical protein C8J57DRAFT_1234183 [Mycena rebaudengoi]
MVLTISPRSTWTLLPHKHAIRGHDAIGLQFILRWFHIAAGVVCGIIGECRRPSSRKSMTDVANPKLDFGLNFGTDGKKCACTGKAVLNKLAWVDLAAVMVVLAGGINFSAARAPKKINGRKKTSARDISPSLAGHGILMTSMDMELEGRDSMSDDAYDTGELAREDGINKTQLLAQDSVIEIEDVAREGA